jgi:ATP-binding cassette subfamily B protein RaxB
MLGQKTVGPEGQIRRIASRKPGDDGLACVVAVLDYYGIKSSLKGLIRRYPQFARGANLRGLMDILESHGLQTRALKCPIESVGGLARPCILHWDMQQFVVLAEIDGQTLYVSDPVRRRSDYTWEEFEAHFSEVALEVFRQ